MSLRGPWGLGAPATLTMRGVARDPAPAPPEHFMQGPWAVEIPLHLGVRGVGHGGG